MPEDFPEGEDQETETPVAHDDIMQRLLRYQRQLRGDEEEGGETTGQPEVPVATSEGPTEPADLLEASGPIPPETPATEASWIEEPPPASTEPPLVGSDVGAAAIPSAPAAGPDGGDLAQRVEQLEQTLAHVARMVTDLRERFQDMAIAADERLGDIERALSVAGAVVVPEEGSDLP